MGHAARPLIEVEYGHNGDRLLALLRQRHPDYHPILNIASIAHQAESEQDLELALKAHSTVLRYVEPELKSVEVKDRRSDRRVVSVSLFEDDEEQRVERAPAPIAIGVIEGELLEG